MAQHWTRAEQLIETEAAVEDVAADQAEAPLNLEISMSLLKPVPAGPLVGRGRVVRRGRKVIFLESELFDAAGTLLARATSTAIPTPCLTGGA